MRVRTWLLFLQAAFMSGCLQGHTGPPEATDPEIRLRVSGGLAGVEYTVRVDGPKREVVGESCVSGCDFQEGELLHGLTREQAAYLLDLFQEAGIHQWDGTDFGTECCDQFHYDLTYSDRDGTSRVQGTSEAFPQELREAVQTVAAFAENVAPVVVDMDADPDRWVRDPAVLDGWEVSGDLAQLRVAYSGGCAVHHFDLIAFGGWQESSPVQISAFLSHDGNGDVCEAWLTRDLLFDLRPLKRAYQETYGVSEPGTTTIVLALDHIPSFSSMSPIPLEYTF